MKVEPHEHHYAISILNKPKRENMGIRDWFKKKEIEPEEKPQSPVVLPELDKAALLEETITAFESEEVELIEAEAIEATPEYDSGDVDLDDLLDDEMESNYDLNTVEESDFEDMLDGAEIIGDLPKEVNFETEEN